MMDRDAFDLALKKLAVRAYSRVKLENVLKKAGFGCGETTAALEKLLEMGYLDDEKLAADIYAFHTTRKPCGRAFLAKKLRQNGISSGVIANLLEQLTDEKEFDLAQQLALRYLASKKAGASCRSLALHLERKGFSPEIIGKIISLHSVDKNIYLD